jgi:hypothetical protein
MRPRVIPPPRPVVAAFVIIPDVLRWPGKMTAHINGVATSGVAPASASAGTADDRRLTQCGR